ncbi:barstar family protein [Streptomyces sp. NPDC059875]|uniref:barstar family protein n=1 Tax=unclassified Streptomyces TaxID=2593676 RepID=UPI0036543A4C
MTRHRPRYTLTRTEDDHVWGVCQETEGLFGEPRRATYELFGWTPVPQRARWLGSRIWLVPEDGGDDPWLLEDVEIVEARPSSAGDGTHDVVLVGHDDYLGPPRSFSGPVFLHDERERWGSGRGFTAVLPPERTEHLPLRLLGCDPSPELREALATGTRRSLDLGQAVLEIRDDEGVVLTERYLRAGVTGWRPSALGRPGLVDVELDGDLLTPVPEYARPIWERWFAGPPPEAGAWAPYDTRHREVWLELVRERGCRQQPVDRPAGHTYELDGRHVTDEPGLYCALGEAVNGPGGYFGSTLDGLDDCLRGGFGFTAPAVLVWRNSGAAHGSLVRQLRDDGEPYDLFAGVLDILARRGVDVVLD